MSTSGQGYAGPGSLGHNDLFYFWPGSGQPRGLGKSIFFDFWVGLQQTRLPRKSISFDFWSEPGQHRPQESPKKGPKEHNMSLDDSQMDLRPSREAQASPDRPEKPIASKLRYTRKNDTKQDKQLK